MDFNTYIILLILVSIADSICMNLTIVQLNTGSNLFHICLCQILVQMHMIYFLFQILGMSQLRSQITIVGKQQHTGRIAVQTAYRINALGAGILYQIHYRATRLRIVGCSHRIFRFVQQYVNFAFDADCLIMELHFVTTFDLGSQLGYDNTVYRNYTSCNKLIGLTA